jgi:site-specific recombinase XerD
MSSAPTSPSSLRTATAEKGREKESYDAAIALPLIHGEDDAWTNSRTAGARFLHARGKSTARAYATDLADFFKHCIQVGIAPLAATRAEVEFYVETLTGARGLMPATVARRLSALSGYFRRALEDDLLTRSPMAGVERPKVPSDSPKLGLSRQELLTLMEGAQAYGLRAHALVALLAYTGCRISELCNAKVGDVGVDRDGVRVLEVTRKGGRRQTLPLTPPAAAAVDAYLAERKDRLFLLGRTDIPLLATRSGGRLDRAGAARQLKRVARRALPGRRDISPHTLRHGYVTLSLDAGVPLRDVQDGAGHSSADTTRRYDRARNAIGRSPAWKLTQYLAGDSMIPKAPSEDAEPRAS